MADRLAGGKLAEEIATHKAAGHSFNHIARLLYADHGIEVTRQTLADWWNALEADPGEKATA